MDKRGLARGHELAVLLQLACVAAAEVADDDVARRRGGSPRRRCGRALMGDAIAPRLQAEGIAGDAEYRLVGDSQWQVLDGGELGGRQRR